MTGIEETVEAQGKHPRRKVVTKGFKRVTLSYLVPTRTLRVVMAYRVLPIQQHEITVSEALVEAVVTAMGEGAIRRLLLDRGFWEGERLGRWHGGGIDVRVPVKRTMAILTDRQGLAALPPDERIVPAERPGAKDAQGHPLDDVRLLGCSALETLESYPGMLNGLVGTAFRGQKLAPEQPWGAITTGPVRTPAEALAAFDAYEDRSLVANAEYRDLKPGYRLPTFIGTEARSVAAHLFCEVLLYSVIALYQQRRASRSVAEGSRRLRRGAWKERLEVVVYVGCWYGLFAGREFATLLGRPPTGRLDATRVRLRPGRRPSGRRCGSQSDGDRDGSRLATGPTSGHLCAALGCRSHGYPPLRSTGIHRQPLQTAHYCSNGAGSGWSFKTSEQILCLNVYPPTCRRPLVREWLSVARIQKHVHVE